MRGDARLGYQRVADHQRGRHHAICRGAQQSHRHAGRYASDDRAVCDGVSRADRSERGARAGGCVGCGEDRARARRHEDDEADY
uniref:Uncharacterized protein n=1 Tax=uncultured marine virus TaxID=186617 RepID=A0A0F7L4W6_9VIRU|nr:hypothetical protein [uncultured marine virus]